MCVDCRPLNDQAVKNPYPLPRIDDLYYKLSGATVFSTLYLQSTYHQVRLKPEDIPKTAFLTPFGHFEFNVLCFGLSRAPATIQAVMNQALGDLIGSVCLVYLDDILISSKDVSVQSTLRWSCSACVITSCMPSYPSATLLSRGPNFWASLSLLMLCALIP